MEETKHNKAFDKLIRSKYQDEKVKPAAHLWKTIQSQLPVVPAPVKPWYLSRIVLIGGSVAAVLGLVSVLFYFIYTDSPQPSLPVVSKSIPSATANPKSRPNKTSSITILKVPYKKNRHTASVNNKKVEISLSQGKHMVTAGVLSPSSGKEKKMATHVLTKSSSLENIQNTRRHLFPITPMKKMNFALPPDIVSVATEPFAFVVAEPESVAQLSGKEKLQVLAKQKSVKKTSRTKAGNKHKYLATKNKQSKSGVKQKPRKPVLHPWSIEVFLMPEFSSRFVTPNPDYTNGVYTPSYFNSREHYTFNYSYGLLVDYRFFHLLSLETGLSYYVYGVDFSTQSSYLEKTGEHSGVVYTSSGKTDLNIDHVDSLNSRAMLSSSSRFDYLSVPIILKFYPAKNLYINAGPTVDYFLGQSNNWDKHDQEGDFNVESGQIEGINRFNISFVFGIGYEKKILKNLSFSINPAIRMHLRKLNPYSPVKTYPYNAGFRVYLRYEL